MKNFYLLLIALFAITTTQAQNVILFEDFEEDTLDIPEAIPTGNDNTWINADFDGLPDGSPSGRPDQWYRTFGFSTLDSNNVVMTSNSWTNDPNTPVANYLILPPIQLFDNTGTLEWKSAPFQTPRYLDGYQVLVSKTGNFPDNFTDTLFYASEYISQPGAVDSSNNTALYNSFQFSPNGFVHGQDGQYTEYNGDFRRLRGVLRPFSASLSAYAGQTIYIAFCHATHDDNLLSVDEIKVSGNGLNLGNEKIDAKNFEIKTIPNPLSDNVRIEYTLPNIATVNLALYDVTGRMVKFVTGGTQLKGTYFYNVDVKDLSAGVYNVILNSSKGSFSTKITVVK
jgi:hypothetical protein